MFRKFSLFLFKLRHRKVHNLIETTMKNIDTRSLGLGICVLKQGPIDLSDPDLKNCIDYRYAISGIPKTNIPRIIGKQTRKEFKLTLLRTVANIMRYDIKTPVDAENIIIR